MKMSIKKTNLLGIGIGDLLLINPVLRLLVLWVFNLLGRVDFGSEVLEEVTEVLTLTVESDIVGVIGAI